MGAGHGKIRVDGGMAGCGDEGGFGGGGDENGLVIFSLSLAFRSTAD